MSSRDSCGDCAFGRGQFVGSRGNPKAPIVFVGESPGSEEFRAGKPFVGPSGGVLDEALPGDWEEDKYYVLNALNCFPIKTKDANRNKKYLQRGISSCRDRLHRDIEAHPRKIIVALGNAALWSLTGNYDLKITVERGKLFDSTLAEYGILASVHPSYLLRGGGSLRKFQEDIGYAVDIATRGRRALKRPVSPEWHILQTVNELVQLRGALVSEAEQFGDNVVAADFETAGFNFREDEILGLGVAIDPAKVWIIPEEMFTMPEAQEPMKALLEEPKLQWCWHNGKFDIKFAKVQNGIDARVDQDTMLQSYTNNEKRGFHDLEQIANDLLGAPNYKHMLKPYLPKRTTSYREVPRPVLYEYLAYDVSNTKQIFNVQETVVQNDPLNNKLYNRVLLPASACLAQIEINGILTDLDKVNENAVHYQAAMQVQRDIVNKYAQETLDKDINLNSWQQVQDLLYHGLGLRSTKRKLMHSFKTDKEHLEHLPQHPAVVAMLAHRGLAKAFGTYVKPIYKLRSAEGRIHTTFLIHGTPTGRLASREPNVQNVKREAMIKAQYIAPPGYCLLEMDLDQAELRCLAQLSGDPALCEIYSTEGMSLHKEVSIELWGGGWVERYAIDTPGDPIYDGAKEEYMRTKALNFGIVYGRTAPSIADEFEESLQEAQRWIAGWATRFPVAWDYIRRCRMAPVRNQNLKTVFGRRKRVEVVGAEKLNDLQNEAANFPHQSTASDINLLAACETIQLLQARGVRIINLIHDAILVECPDDPETVDWTCRLVTSTMERIPVDWGLTRIPFKADAKKGYRWSEVKAHHFDP